MCDVWPCCPVDGINVRRWNISGTVAWQTRLLFMPKAICGIDGSRTIVVGEKTSLADYEVICLAADGSTEWAADIGSQIITTLTYEQYASGTSKSQGYWSKAVSICMRSTYELVVGVNFYWRSTSGTSTFHHSLVAIVDNTTGTVTATTANLLREILEHTSELVGAATTYSGDTAFVRCLNNAIIPVDATNVALADAMPTLPAVGFPYSRTIRALHTDSDSAFVADSYTSGADLFGSIYMGALGGATTASTTLRHPSATFYAPLPFIGTPPQKTIYGFNQLAISALTGASYGYGTIVKVNASTLAIDGYLSLAADGGKYKSYNAWVVENVTYYNWMYVLCAYNFTQLALIDDAGVWQWRHRIYGFADTSSITAGHVGPDGDLCTIHGVPTAGLLTEQQNLSPTQPATATSN